MADRVVVCVGTRKGLFVFRSDRKRERWAADGPFLKGWQVYHAVVDSRSTPRLYAAGSSEVFATTVFGNRYGKKLRGAKRPPVPPKLNARQRKQHRRFGINPTPRVWHIEPGRASEPKVLYAGTAPAGLYRSEDSGQTWEEVGSITRHPTRKHWQPGFGGMCLHSIQLDPQNEKRMYVAISAAGAFRTEDGGKSWETINKNVARLMESSKDSQVGT